MVFVNEKVDVVFYVNTSVKGGENMDEMTTPELNQYLETIAKLIEAAAKTPQEAAQIVRKSKVKM